MPGCFRRLDELLVFLAKKRCQQDFTSRQDHGLRAGGERALGAGIEMADGFDFVVEKLQPQGVFNTKRIDVKDAAADAELPHAVDGGNAFKTAICQMVTEPIQRVFFAAFDVQGAQLQGVRRH